MGRIQGFSLNAFNRSDMAVHGGNTDCQGGGELNWRDFLRFAKEELAFDGFISIEHEDREFAWPDGDLETRKKGFEYGLNILRRAIEAI
jgi:sugar phosphate isomerase/epimerase